MFWHYCLLAIVWRATWKLNKRAVGFTMLVGLPLCVTNPLLAGEAAVIFYDAVDKVAMTLPEDCGKPLPNLLESIRTWQSEQDYQAIGYVSRSLPTTMNSDNYHKTVQDVVRLNLMAHLASYEGPELTLYRGMGLQPIGMTKDDMKVGRSFVMNGIATFTEDFEVAEAFHRRKRFLDPIILKVRIPEASALGRGYPIFSIAAAKRIFADENLNLREKEWIPTFNSAVEIKKVVTQNGITIVEGTLSPSDIPLFSDESVKVLESKMGKKMSSLFDASEVTAWTRALKTRRGIPTVPVVTATGVSLLFGEVGETVTIWGSHALRSISARFGHRAFGISEKIIATFTRIGVMSETVALRAGALSSVASIVAAQFLLLYEAHVQFGAIQERKAEADRLARIILSDERRVKIMRLLAEHRGWDLAKHPVGLDPLSRTIFEIISGHYAENRAVDLMDRTDGDQFLLKTVRDGEIPIVPDDILDLMAVANAWWWQTGAPAPRTRYEAFKRNPETSGITYRHLNRQAILEP